MQKKKKSHAFRTFFATSNWYWQNVCLVHDCFQISFIFYLKIKQTVCKAEQIHTQLFWRQVYTFPVPQFHNCKSSFFPKNSNVLKKKKNTHTQHHYPPHATPFFPFTFSSIIFFPKSGMKNFWSIKNPHTV